MTGMLRELAQHLEPKRPLRTGTVPVDDGLWQQFGEGLIRGRAALACAACTDSMVSELWREKESSTVRAMPTSAPVRP